MKVLRPAVALVLVAQSIPVVFSECFFGKFECADGESYCLNPLSVASCTFSAVSPIVLDKIIPAVGNALKDIAPNEMDFAIELGVQEVTKSFEDFRDCVKMFGGKVAKCDVLHNVHACVSTALSATKGLKAAGKFAKLGDKLGVADKALDAIESQVIPRLQDQCAGGCFNAPTCSVPARGSTGGQVVQTTTTTTTKTECYNTSVDPIPQTLEYEPPQGCTCLQLAAHAYDKDADANIIDKCALNLAFFMNDLSPPKLMGKALFPDMGCFVGKLTKNGCEAATLLDRSDVDYTYDFTWEQSELQHLYFIPCEDQFGRKYSDRNKTVTVAPTPAPTYCKTYDVTTTTNTTTNSTTNSTTSTEPSNATAWQRSWFTMIALCIALLAVPTWWLAI